jgi:hypothetical protein
MLRRATPLRSRLASDLRHTRSRRRSIISIETTSHRDLVLEKCATRERQHEARVGHEAAFFGMARVL